MSANKPKLKRDMEIELCRVFLFDKENKSIK